MAPSPYDYTVQQPNVGSYFDAMRQGRTDRLAVEQEQRNNALSRYLPGALQGDDGQRKSALDAAAGDPNMVIQLSQSFSGADRVKLEKAREVNGQLASLAMWADSPDKWPIALAEARKLSPEIGDIPFEQRGAIIAKFQTVSEQLEAAYKKQMLANDTSRTTAQNSLTYAQIDDLKQQRLLQAQAQGTGPKLSPRDEKMLNEATEQSGAAQQSIATMLNVVPNFKAAGNSLGPGAGWQRSVAGVLSSIPGVTSIEKALSSDGSSQSENVVTNFDRIEGASKKLGAELLKMFGGSDTQLELLTAIQTTIDPRKDRSYNEAIFRDQLAAADILSKKADLMTRWANKFGGVNRVAPSGETWNSFWAKYQKEAWTDWRKQSFSFDNGLQPAGRPAGAPRNYRQEQRDLLSGKTTQSGPVAPPGYEVFK